MTIQMKKRDFLKTLSMAGLALPLLPEGMAEILARHENSSPAALAGDDAFWAGIRAAYDLKPDYVNLENGFYCLMPKTTLESYIQDVRSMNREGSYYMRTKLEDDKVRIRQAMAAFLDCPVDEVVITRNATESIDTVIAGMDWKSGDEAVMAEQDYGAMLDMFKQQSRRYGTVNKIISIPNHPKEDEEIVALYEGCFTPKTRLLLVSHMIN